MTVRVISELYYREEITYQQATIYYFVYRINTMGFRFTDMNLLMNFEK